MIKDPKSSPSLLDSLLFAGRVFLFVLLCFLFIIIIFFISRDSLRSMAILPDTVSTIICGDSHTQTALNDLIIPNSKNISTNSQPYYYTYCVLSLLLDQNPQVNTVILGYSFHSFSSIFDHMLYDDSLANVNAISIRDYYSVVDYRYLFNLFVREPRKTLNTITTNSMNLLFSLNDVDSIQDLPFIGAYKVDYGFNLDEESVERNIQRHYYATSGNPIIGDSYQLQYLQEIAYLCCQKDIDLFLVNCPISSEYYTKIPKDVLDQYYAVALTIDATLLDNHDCHLPNFCYYNADHLNFYGAILFSLSLDAVLMN